MALIIMIIIGVLGYQEGAIPDHIEGTQRIIATLLFTVVGAIIANFLMSITSKNPHRVNPIIGLCMLSFGYALSYTITLLIFY